MNYALAVTSCGATTEANRHIGTYVTVGEGHSISHSSYPYTSQSNEVTFQGNVPKYVMVIRCRCAATCGSHLIYDKAYKEKHYKCRMNHLKKILKATRCCYRSFTGKFIKYLFLVVVFILIDFN
jgi:hypothetical protein